MEGGEYGEGGDPSSNLIKFAVDTLPSNGNISQTESNNFTSRGVNVQSPVSLQQKICNDNDNKINYNLRFKDTDSGPFCVYVEHDTLNVGQLHPMKVGNILSEFTAELQAEIIEVLSVGRNRIKIFLKSGASANFLIGHEIFIKHKLKSYIPQHLVEKKALVRNVDTSLSEGQLLQKIVSTVPVSGVKRLTRYTTDASGNKITVPRQMIIVTFSGRFIPDHIVIDYVRCPVETYVSPVMQCFTCLRYGHSSRLCKGKKRCRTCGVEHEGDCAGNIYCIYCKNNSHNSTSRVCPKYVQQKNIKNIMATKNISFREAEKLVGNPSLFSNVLKHNPFAPLSILNNKEFPSINEVTKPPSAISQSSSNMNRNPTKRKKPVNSQSQPRLDSKVPKQDSTRNQTAPLRSSADIQLIRHNLIAAIGELLERLHRDPSHAQNQNKESITEQIDLVINKVFGVDNIQISNVEFTQDPSMEL